MGTWELPKVWVTWLSRSVVNSELMNVVMVTIDTIVVVLDKLNTVIREILFKLLRVRHYRQTVTLEAVVTVNTCVVNVTKNPGVFPGG